MTKKKNIIPTRSDVQGLCEHALLKDIPDSTRTTAHWLIANAQKVEVSIEMLEFIQEWAKEADDCQRSTHLCLDHSTFAKKANALIAKATAPKN